MEEKLLLTRDAAEEAAQAAPAGEAIPAGDAAAETIPGDAVAALRAELETEMSRKLAAMRDDALRLSRMSDEERALYEASRRESELAAREKALLARELRAQAVELLAERGLPRQLADAIGYESESAMRAAVDAIERAFRQAVQAAVEERLRGESPAAGASAQSAEDALLDDADYYRLNYDNH